MIPTMFSGIILHVSTVLIFNIVTGLSRKTIDWICRYRRCMLVSRIWSHFSLLIVISISFFFLYELRSYASIIQQKIWGSNLYNLFFIILFTHGAHGSSTELIETCPCFPDWIGIWKCCFLRLRENQSTRRSKGVNQQQTQTTYGANTRIQTWATLVGGECCHHWASFAPLLLPLNSKQLKH